MEQLVSPSTRHPSGVTYIARDPELLAAFAVDGLAYVAWYCWVFFSLSSRNQREKKEEKMRTVFVVLPMGHAGLAEADELEHTLTFYLQRRNIAHTSRSYWDDGEYDTEYGVRLDISEPFDDDNFLRLLGGIVYLTSLLHGSIRIQLDDNCVTT